jgi:hypothetical protein
MLICTQVNDNRWLHRIDAFDQATIHARDFFARLMAAINRQPLFIGYVRVCDYRKAEKRAVLIIIHLDIA